VPASTPTVQSQWNALVAQSGEEAAYASFGQSFDASSLADACKKLDINIGKRYEDTLFRRVWVRQVGAMNATDIERGEVFGGDDFTGKTFP